MIFLWLQRGNYINIMQCKSQNHLRKNVKTYFLVSKVQEHNVSKTKKLLYIWSNFFITNFLFRIYP